MDYFIYMQHTCNTYAVFRKKQFGCLKTYKVFSARWFFTVIKLRVFPDNGAW
jgi:hypothetical protein